MPKGREREWAPVRIADAYQELSKEGFAVWILMAVTSAKVLESGLGKMASEFGYKERGFRKVLSELRNKGYVRYVTRTRLPVPLQIARRPLLAGHDRFVKLS